jgi:two-component system, chemotaxis family, sensor kinase CheA
MTREDDENLGFFLADAAEAIRDIEESLLTLEGDPANAAEINRLYRGMHTLKGNAAFLELLAIEKVAHACEDLVSLPRDAGVEFDLRMVNLLLESLDKLRWAVAFLKEHRHGPEFGEVEDIVRRLGEAFREMGGTPVTNKNTLLPGFAIFDELPSVTAPAAIHLTERKPSVRAVPSVRPSNRSAAVGAASAFSAPSPATALTQAAAAKDTPMERSEFLRVDATKVGALMDLAGELGLACSAVTRHDGVLAHDIDGFAAAAHRLELLVRELQNDLSSLRLVPVSPVFQRMRRVVRDAARRTGKDVDFVVLGEDTEVDKVMLDALQDPLVHVLRNAVDHGLETTEERTAAGKSARGRIVLSATHQGGEVTIEVRDDGRGLNRERILARAKERGLCAEGANPSDDEIAQFVFLPGFSTKEAVDSLSGRGVGMDVLKTTVEGLRGRVVLKSVSGQGSRVSLNMPLTLAFVEAMVVRDGDRLFALPIEKVFEVSKVAASHMVTNSADRQVMIRVRDTCIPVLWLGDFWGEKRDASDLEGRLVVVVQTSRGALALPVDELIGNQQVMLKPLHGPLSEIRAAAGCGMLRTGDVAIALDCDRLYA